MKKSDLLKMADQMVKMANEIYELIKEDDIKRGLNQPPNAQAFVRWYCEEYKAKMGAPYAASWARDGKIVKTLLAIYGEEPLKKFAQSFLESDDEWIRSAGKTIPTFQFKINVFATQNEEEAKASRWLKK